MAVAGIAAVLCVALTACVDEEMSSGTSHVQGIEFSIIEISTLQSLKRTVSVRLNQRVSEDVLHIMAQELYVPGYDRTFILYLLPHMKIGEEICWATTHFNPDLEIRVLGLTPEQLEILVAMPSTVVIPPGELIGKWFWEVGELSRRITIYQKRGVLYMEQMFLDGSNSNEELIEKASSQGRRFEEYGASWGEYYLLDHHGDLHMGDEEGLFETFQKLTQAQR